jgi:hypothetical protein
MSDNALDRTTAWFVSCVTIFAVVSISWWGINYRYGQETIRKAVESGYCEVANVPANGYYHWEKCPVVPPAVPQK